MVTGAVGFVGSHLLPALRGAFPSATLIAAVRREDTGPTMRAIADEVVPFDLLDTDGIVGSVAAVRPDGVVHLAAQASVAASFADPTSSWRVNLLGTIALAEAVLRYAPTCRFVLASSAEIYGLSFRAEGPLDEGAPLAPTNPYAATKAACDLAIGEMALRGLNAVRLRAFNHTGTGQSDSFVVAAFAHQLARIEAGRQEPVLHVGNLDRWRDFLDVDDVCTAYAAALRYPVSPGSIFNIASGTSRRIGDILDALLARSPIRPRVVVDAGHLRPTDIERVVGDATQARKMFGWAPAISWDKTLDAVLGDWRQRVSE
jgi:GDP-4-dehydro-6-deoxy-D-mannose reductase